MALEQISPDFSDLNINVKSTCSFAVPNV